MWGNSPRGDGESRDRAERCSRAAVGGLRNVRWWFGAMCARTQVVVCACASIIFISLRHYLDHCAEGGRWGNPVFFSPLPPPLYLFSALSVSASRSESRAHFTSCREVVVAGRGFFFAQCASWFNSSGDAVRESQMQRKRQGLFKVLTAGNTLYTVWHCCGQVPTGWNVNTFVLRAGCVWCL